MQVGTRSVLYGAHCWCVHPLFVAWAWWSLYGFPWDPRLWVAFFVHDLGYLGKPNMDGPEGELHPTFGANIMGLLFGPQWESFTLLHSRYFAKKLNQQPSRLCIADKLALAITPAWLYLPMARWTGEIQEYMAQAKFRIIGNKNVNEAEKALLLACDEKAWFSGVQAYMVRWVEAHKDGQKDAWTSSSHLRATQDSKGNWR